MSGRLNGPLVCTSSENLLALQLGIKAVQHGGFRNDEWRKDFIQALQTKDPGYFPIGRRLMRTLLFVTVIIAPDSISVLANVSTRCTSTAS